MIRLDWGEGEVKDDCRGQSLDDMRAGGAVDTGTAGGGDLRKVRRQNLSLQQLRW